MTRKKIEIKKIDNATARQVTFSKRRRGLFKKAEELSTLCDAEVAVMVFSNTGKLFHHSNSTSSVEQVIKRYSLYSEKLDKLNQPSLELQLESSSCAMLRKQIAEKTHELRQIMGEELQELDLQKLNQLDNLVSSGLRRVTDAKGEKFLNEINFLKWKGAQLMKENKLLKQMARTSWLQTVLESSAPDICSSSADPPQDHDSSDTSLKLGLPFPN
ncbi:hypothetical protein M0R45_008788 [Rubus argutus]|uniref:Uncharacterized protein n=1 Tax=Rubus argutus TaxID=59490 RepID=A0AAW1Y540_RUBAR